MGQMAAIVTRVESVLYSAMCDAMRNKNRRDDSQ